MQRIPFRNSYRVSSLSQIYTYIRWIQDYAAKPNLQENEGRAQTQQLKPENGGKFPPIWFRGHEDANYTLLASLLRDNKVSTAPIDDRNPTTRRAIHSTIHTQEDQRHYAFRSKMNHMVSYVPGPCNQLEWQEYMQHHSMRTRMLDWSETLHAALAFALRAFLDPKNTESERARRQKIDPVLWVLLPTKLNELVYESLIDPQLISHAIQCLTFSDDDHLLTQNRMFRNLKKYKEIYFHLSENNKQQLALNKLISLSVIDQNCATCGALLPSMLKDSEYNPFHYLLTRYYSHALPTQKTLPPLATLHPYHSDRIRAQHGSFTIFPINTANNENGQTYSYRNAMEHIAGMHQCLFEIRITNANQIAHELLLSGIRESTLFPEPEVFSNEFETERYYY